MRMDFFRLSAFVCFLGLFCVIRDLAVVEAYRPMCQPNQVCKSLSMALGIMYPDEDICSCDSCKSYWDDQDGYSLTWEHYDNNNWMVQYRFCNRIWPERMCGPGDNVAAVISVDELSWNPTLVNFKCRCSQGYLIVKSWKLVGSKWMYYYTCQRRPNCRSESEPCVKFNLDYWNTKKTLGYTFNCDCEDGYVCPGDVGQEWDNRDYDPFVTPVTGDGTDESGYYLNGYCHSIEGERTKPRTTAYY